MNQVFALLFRCTIIIGGYIVACLAAGGALTILFTAWLAVPAEDPGGFLAGPLVFAIPVVSIIVAYFALLPSMVLILLSEILGKRDWLFHALGGAAVSVAVIGYMWRETGSPYGPSDGGDFMAIREYWFPAAADPGVAATLVAAGICGGIGYWLVAGRTAGNWRQRRDITSPGR